jgi:hypothetical protein
MDEEPMLLGTDRKDGEIYREYLQAIPMPSMQLHARVDDLALDKLYMDYPFNWTQQLALFHLGTLAFWLTYIATNSLISN